MKSSGIALFLDFIFSSDSRAARALKERSEMIEAKERELREEIDELDEVFTPLESALEHF